MMAEEQSTIKRAPGHPHLERERQEKTLQGAEKLYKRRCKDQKEEILNVAC